MLRSRKVRLWMMTLSTELERREIDGENERDVICYLRVIAYTS